jgi:hypothetical protein
LLKGQVNVFFVSEFLEIKLKPICLKFRIEWSFENEFPWAFEASGFILIRIVPMQSFFEIGAMAIVPITLRRFDDVRKKHITQRLNKKVS